MSSNASSSLTTATATTTAKNHNSHTIATLFIIKKNGNVGKGLKWTSDRSTDTFVIGRESQCDVRVQLLTASRRHCIIRKILSTMSDAVAVAAGCSSNENFDPKFHFVLENYSRVNPTTLNGNAVSLFPASVFVPQNSVIGVGDRSFQFVYSDGYIPDDDSMIHIRSESVFHIQNGEDKENLSVSAGSGNDTNDDPESTCQLSQFVRKNQKRQRVNMNMNLSAVKECDKRKKIRAELRAKYFVEREQKNSFTDNALRVPLPSMSVVQKIDDNKSVLLAKDEDQSKAVLPLSFQQKQVLSKSLTTPLRQNIQAAAIVRQEKVEQNYPVQSLSLPSPMKKELVNTVTMHEVNMVDRSKLKSVLDTPLKKAIHISAALRQQAREKNGVRAESISVLRTATKRELRAKVGL